MLIAATDLFYREGITATGVDRVAASAGVTKATLYNNFRSKEELVAACLRGQMETWSAAIASEDRPDADAATRVSILFDMLSSDTLRPDYRGCPFTNAAVEMRRSELVMAVVREYRDRFSSHVSDMVAGSDASVADAVVYLYDGSIAAVKATEDLTHIARARDAALRAL